jgi:hypothetical protein
MKLGMCPVYVMDVAFVSYTDSHTLVTYKLGSAGHLKKHLERRSPGNHCPSLVSRTPSWMLRPSSDMTLTLQRPMLMAALMSTHFRREPSGMYCSIPSSVLKNRSTLGTWSFKDWEKQTCPCPNERQQILYIGRMRRLVSLIKEKEEEET